MDSNNREEHSQNMRRMTARFHALRSMEAELDSLLLVNTPLRSRLAGGVSTTATSEPISVSTADAGSKQFNRISALPVELQIMIERHLILGVRLFYRKPRSPWSGSWLMYTHQEMCEDVCSICDSVADELLDVASFLEVYPSSGNKLLHLDNHNFDFVDGIHSKTSFRLAQSFLSSLGEASYRHIRRISLVLWCDYERRSQSLSAWKDNYRQGYERVAGVIRRLLLGEMTRDMPEQLQISFNLDFLEPQWFKLDLSLYKNFTCTLNLPGRSILVVDLVPENIFDTPENRRLDPTLRICRRLEAAIRNRTLYKDYPCSVEQYNVWSQDQTGTAYTDNIP